RLFDLSSGTEHAVSDTRARSRHDSDNPPHRLRERSGRDFRPAGGRPFLCDPSDRLANGSVRVPWPWSAPRLCLFNTVGATLPGALTFVTVKALSRGRRREWSENR